MIIFIILLSLISVKLVIYWYTFIDRQWQCIKYIYNVVLNCICVVYRWCQLAESKEEELSDMQDKFMLDYKEIAGN